MGQTNLPKAKDDIPNGWDVRLIARRIWELESKHESDAFKLVRNVSDKWIEETRRLYSDPSYIRYKRRTHPNSNIIANAAFAATDNSGQLAVRGVNVTFDVKAFDATGNVRLDFPSMDLSPPYWISAGYNEIIKEFMGRATPRAKQFMKRWETQNSRLTSSARQAALAKEMIALSLKLQPHLEEIGPPIEVLQIKPRSGMLWIANEDKCPNR